MVRPCVFYLNIFQTLDFNDDIVTCWYLNVPLIVIKVLTANLLAHGNNFNCYISKTKIPVSNFAKHILTFIINNLN